MGARRNWTRNELILAFNLYCRTPFGKIHTRNPDVIELARILARTPSAVSWKLANFARLDPTLAKRNIKGAGHGSKEEEAIWHEFESDWDSLAFESERLRLGKAEVESVRVDEEFPEGITRDALVKLRVNQGFFRSAVLSAYGAACCITGINVPALLCASHIVPWSRDVKNRANPSNGLCLNALHDRAFDRGLLTITPDYRVMISPKITSLKRQEGLATMLLSHEGKVIAVPKHFLPGKDFLRHHNENIFQS